MANVVAARLYPRARNKYNRNYGEHEQCFFVDSACYLTWEGTEDRDLHHAKTYEGIKALLPELYPNEKPETRIIGPVRSRRQATETLSRADTEGR